MRLTQGTFSYLPDLTDEQVTAQIQYAVDQGWALSIEYTDDPHPRNVYWEMWGLPLFDLRDAAGARFALDRCRQDHRDCYIRVSAYDASRGRQTTALQFIVARPAQEPGFRLERQETSDRRVRYRLHACATDTPTGRDTPDDAL